ncbi:MAG: gliding motility lipoprotein GldH [Dysgonamonadaceae bacterium]|jgi:gliding motility-associated lipoprotein GldH|nr:gliding motility lipoprotein GldH [Dysgonamonadaceae bacterium]
MKRFISTGATGLLFFLLASCVQDEAFFEYHSFQKSGWNREAAAIFSVDIDNTTDLFDISVEIRNNNDYSFRNIWLLVDFQSPGGNVRTDTIGMYLADVSGKWYGTGISLYSLTIPYKTAVRFPEKGAYTCFIRHGMSENPLKGISDVGLKVSKKINE